MEPAVEPQVPSKTCPSNEVLRAFALGDLSEEDIDSVRRHQEACPRCEARAKTFDQGTDPLLDDLRRSVARRDEPCGADEPPAIPDYQITGPPLGAGATGIVYPARHIKLGRPVALKTIAQSSVAIARLFELEARAVARLQHPNIVQIYDVGRHANRPFLALEFIDGGSLRERINDGVIELREALRIILIVAEALDHAHRQGIVHCDLKPSNILVTTDGIPKIADFGIARWTESETYWEDASGSVGTPRYMAPEQRSRGGAVGPSADVYSLGVILCEMILGRTPGPGPESDRDLAKLPPDIEILIRRCLQSAPADRYPDAQGLADDLAVFLAGRATNGGRLDRSKRRGTRLAILAAAGMLVAGLNWGLRLVPAPPPVPMALVPQDDGSFRLGAAAARVSGVSLRFEDSFGNLGYWHGRKDRALWAFHIKQSGRLRVAVEYANRNGDVGNRYEVRIDGVPIVRDALATAGWSDYRRFPVDEVVLDVGVHSLEVRPVEPLRGALFDLRAVVLQPVKP